MPVNEVFNAKLTVSTPGVKDAIKNLELLAEAANNTTSALSNMGQVKISFRRITSDIEKFKTQLEELSGFQVGKRGGLIDPNVAKEQRRFAELFRESFGDLATKPINDLEQSMSRVANIIGSTTDQVRALLLKMQRENEGIFNFIPEGAEEARVKTVGQSPIPDLVNQIKWWLAQIPEETQKQVSETIKEFERLSREAIPNFEELTAKGTPKLGEAIRGVKAQQVAQQMAGFRDVFSTIAVDVEKFRNAQETAWDDFLQRQASAQAAMGEFKQAMTDAGETVRQAGEKASQGIDRINESFDESDPKVRRIQDDFNSLLNVGDNTATQLSDRFRGLSLAVTTPGARLQGLREAFFGVQQSSSLFVRGLDLIISRGNEVDKLTNRLQKQVFDLGNDINESTRSLNSQANELRKFAKAETDALDATDEFDKQLTRVNQSFRKVITTAREGGDVGKALAGARTATEELEFEYKQLTESGILPADSASRRMLDEMIRQIRTNEQRLQGMNVRYANMTDEIEKARRKQNQANQEFEETGSIFKRITVNIGNFFNVFRRSSTTVNEFNDQLDRTDDKISKVARTADLAKAAFAGAFGGAVVTSLLFRFQEALEDVGRQFFELNDLIQNTEITIKGMLTGTSLNIEQSLGGFRSFIEEEVARTPFEYGDAIEAALQLVQQGFDPQRWFRPAANAAAAMNKPLEQFIGGLTKLVSGATGSAIDIFRDFGLNVNNVFGIFDKTTGQVLNQQEALEAAALSTEEFEKRYTKLGFEFDKQGSLTNSTGEALKILNAYLTQNATFAQAASARSQSLSGVISNLKDAFSKALIALGQPIFERLTIGATGLLNLVDTLSPKINAFATLIGTQVGRAIDIVSGVFSGLEGESIRIPEALQNIVNLFSAIIQGDWAAAWADLVTVATDAMSWLFDSLDWLLESAFSWGVSYVTEIANGIIDAANSILISAMNAIGDMMASFMAPGSPPQRGPLSTIDQWGQGLIDEFLGSMEVDTGKFVNQTLKPLADTFKDWGAEGGKAFEGFADGVLAVVGELDKTGRINDELFEQQVRRQALLGATNDEEKKEAEEIIKQLRKQLEARAKLKAAQEEQNAVTEEISAAEQEGFIPATLKAKLKAAEQSVQAAEEEIKAEDEKAKIIQEFSEIRQSAYKEDTKAAKAPAAAAASAAKQMQKSWRDAYANNLKNLQEMYDRGVISEEDYLTQLLKLEKDYVKKSLEEGVTEGLDEHIAKIKEIEGKLAQFKDSKGIKKAGDAIKEAFTPPSIEEIFRGFEQRFKDQMGLTGEEGGESFAVKLENRLVEGTGEAFNKMKSTLKSKLKELGTTFIQGMKNLFEQDPLIFSLIAGGLTLLITPAIVSGLSALGALLLGVATALGSIALTATGFIAVGLVITTIILNWDKIVTPAADAWAYLASVFEQFVDRMGGAESLLQSFNTFVESVEDNAKIIGTALKNALVQIVTELDFSGAWNVLVEGISQVNLSPIKSFLTSALSTIISVISGELTRLGDIIIGLLPQPVVNRFQQLKDQVIAFFQQGRLGGELVNLFNQLKELFIALVPILKAVGIIIAAAIGLILAALAGLVSGFIDALPFIERAIAGIIRVISGLVNVFTSIVDIIRAGWAAITGDTTTAEQLFRAAMQNLTQGVADILGGLVNTVTSLLGGLVVFVVNSIQDMIGIILAFIPGMEDVSTEFFNFSDNFQAGFLELTDNVIGYVSRLVNEIPVLLFSLWEKGLEAFRGFAEDVIYWAYDVYNQLVGNSIFTDLVNDIVNLFFDLPNRLLGIGGKIIEAIAGGLSQEAGGLVSKVGGVLGSLFSGGAAQQDQGTGATAAIQAFLQLGTSGTDIITQLSTLWNTFTTNMPVLINTAVLAIQTHFSNHLIFQTIFIQNLTILWQTFLNHLNVLWENTMATVTELVNQFHQRVDQILNLINALLDVTAEQFVMVGEAAVDAADDIEDAMSGVKNTMDKLLDILDQVITRFNDMANAAQRAASAARGAVNTGGGGSPRGFQAGTLNVPGTGLYRLHDREAVLPPRVAESFRSFLSSIGRYGIGNKSYGLGGLNLAGAAAAATGGLGNVSSSNKVINLTMHNTISNGMDLAQFERQVINIVSRNM